MNDVPKGRVIAQIVKTKNLHLATLLGTIGAKPSKTGKGPEVLSNGQLVTWWTFESTQAVDEAVALWQSPGAAKDWSELTIEERRTVIDIVSAFAGNLSGFLRTTR